MLTHHSPKKRIFVPNVGSNSNQRASNNSFMTEADSGPLQLWIQLLQDMPDHEMVDQNMEKKFDAILRNKLQWEPKRKFKSEDDDDFEEMI